MDGLIKFGVSVIVGYVVGKALKRAEDKKKEEEKNKNSSSSSK